jgi:hypothetical protein
MAGHTNTAPFGRYCRLNFIAKLRWEMSGQAA